MTADRRGGMEHIGPIVRRVLHSWSAGIFEYGTKVCQCRECGTRKLSRRGLTEYWTRDGKVHDRAPPCERKPAA